MNPKIFNDAISVVKRYYDTSELNVKVGEIISELWSKPVDEVFLKYKTPKTIVDEFYNKIADIDFSKLKIKPFDDYEAIQSISIKKILVTTGLRELQTAKIKALGIASDFDSIRIDDPREKPRQYKMDIFKQILTETKKSPKEIWIIGDNPESEIKAGKILGMRTIQRKSKTKESSEYADFEIASFRELKNIIK